MELVLGGARVAGERDDASLTAQRLRIDGFTGG